MLLLTLYAPTLVNRILTGLSSFLEIALCFKQAGDSRIAYQPLSTPIAEA